MRCSSSRATSRSPATVRWHGRATTRPSTARAAAVAVTRSAVRSAGDDAVDQLGDRLAGGQARRLDADQVDQLRRAVAARLLDHEVADRLAGALQLGPDAGVAGG